MGDEIVKANDRARRKAFIDLARKTSGEQPKPEDAKALRKMLKETPTLSRIYGDLTKRGREILLNKMKITEASLPFSLSVTVGLDAIRDDLGYQDAPALERLLIEQVLIDKLRMDLTESLYTITVVGESISLGQASYWERRLSAVQRRYLRACETLARIRKMQLPAVQVNIATKGGQQVNVQGMMDGGLGGRKANEEGSAGCQNLLGGGY